MRFKLAGFVAAVSLATAQSAYAADMPAKAPMPTKAPAVVPFTWTGSYIGGFVGGASAAKDVSTTDPIFPAVGGVFNGVAPTSYRLGSSVIAGFTGGYNWQFAPHWVVGYESETGYLRMRGSAVMSPANDTVAFTNYGNWYSAYTARFGYAFDRSLIYAKGGVALTRIETGVVDTTGVTLDTSARKWKAGYAVGGGLEYAIDSKWSLKAEYLYLGFGKNFDTTGTIPTNPGAGTGFSTTSLSGIHTAKIGLNYKWDWFGLFR
jgi:outer membrane immunogenic protein